MTETHTEFDRLKTMAKDAAYTSVGVGLLTFQKAQVRRRELMDQMQREFPRTTSCAMKQAEAAISKVATTLNAIIVSRSATRSAE